MTQRQIHMIIGACSALFAGLCVELLPGALVALCSGCHLRADAKFHAEHRRERR